MDYRTVEEQRNALREQNEKLQGSIKSQDTIIRRLSKEETSLYAELEKYKKAFDEIFTKNASGEWEKFLEESGKDADDIPLDEKVSFFNKTINDTRLYILRKAIEKARLDLAKENADVDGQIREQKTRIGHLTEIASELMNQMGLSSLFKSAPSSAGMYKTELEGFATDALASGKDFRTKLSMAMVNIKPSAKPVDAPTGKNNKDEGEAMQPTEERKEEAVSTPPRAPSMSEAEILANAYKDFIEQHPEKGITMETENFTDEIKKDVKKHIGSKTLELLKIDTSTDEGMEKITNWADAIKRVVAYIGTTGNSRKALIESELKSSPTNENGIENGIMKNLFPTCEEIGLLVQGVASGAGRGRPSANYVLSSLGKIYFSTFTEEYTHGIPLRQSKIMSSSDGTDEKSVAHTDLIHQMSALLDEYGYEWKDEDEQFIPGTANSSQCDILATRDGKTVRIECELGNGERDHYKVKIDKIFEVTPYALFIAPNQTAARSLSNMLMDVKGSKSELKKKGLFWEVVSFEDAKKRFKEDASWPIRKADELVKQKASKGKLTPVIESTGSWG